MLARKRNVLIGGVALVLFAYAGYCMMGMRYRRNLLETNDVYAALVFYLDAHHGQFPTSEAALRRSAFINEIPSGEIVVTAVPTSDLVSKVYGEPIRDLASFDIAYGVDLTTLRVADNGHMVDNRTGKEVLLMRSRFGVEDSWPVCAMILRASQEIRRKDAETRPGGN